MNPAEGQVSVVNCRIFFLVFLLRIQEAEKYSQESKKERNRKEYSSLKYLKMELYGRVEGLEEN